MNLIGHFLFQQSNPVLFHKKVRIAILSPRIVVRMPTWEKSWSGTYFRVFWSFPRNL